MKKRTIASIVAIALLGCIGKSLYKRFASPIIAAAKYWDDRHNLVSTINADDCVIVSTIRNHYLKCPDGEMFLILSNTRLNSRYPSWMIESADEFFSNPENPTVLSSAALFTAKFALVEHKLSGKDRRNIKLLGIALFERPITLTYDQANLVKEKMISILNKATKKSKKFK